MKCSVGSNLPVGRSGARYSFAKEGDVYFTPASDGCYDFKISVHAGVKAGVRTLFKGLEAAVGKTSARWRSTGCARLSELGVKLPSRQGEDSSPLGDDQHVVC